MSDYQLITIRAIFAYLALFGMTKLMGKREVSQLTFFDYIVGISIGTIAGSLALDTSKNFLSILPALIIFGLFQIIISYASLKSKGFRKIAAGSPTVLIEKGKVLEKNLAKTRVNIDELKSKLRENNAFAIADVEYALLETDGKISVQKKPNKQALTPSDMSLPGQYSGLSTLVVEEGQINGDTLKARGLTRSWLMSKLGEQGYTDISQIMFAQVDESGKVYVDLMEK